MPAFRNRITKELIECEPEDQILGIWQVNEARWSYIVPANMTAAVARKQALERSCILEIGASAENGRKQGWKQWVDVPSILPNRAARVQLLPFDLEIESRIRHLQEVCREPRMHLTTEIEKVRASSARRLPSGASEYLAAHSEDWQQRSFGAVQPRRVLSVQVDDLFDIYENRVTVRLVDRLLEYVHDRLQDLRKLAAFIDEAKQYQNDCRGSFWKERRLYKELGELYSDQQYDHAISTVRFLEALERKLLGLCASNLYQAVPQRAQVPISLRETNILANDQHYRHVAHLWRVWAEWYQHRALTKAQLYQETQRICSSFEEYGALLVSKALASLGFKPTEDSCFASGSGAVYLDGPWGVLSFRYDEDGSIALKSADWHRSLRFVAIPDLLTTANTSAVAAQSKFSVIDRAVRKQIKDSLVILYPGSEAERRQFPPPLRRQFHSLWSECLPGETTPISLLAVGPLVIDSIEDVGRAINMWRAEGQLAQYPPTVSCPNRLTANLLVKSGLFTQSGPDVVEFRRPVLDKELERIKSSLQRVNSDGPHRSPLFNEQSIDALAGKIHEAGAWYDKVLQCPVCGDKADASSFRPLDRDTYRVSCNVCKARWGLRQCKCGEAYPFLNLHSASSSPLGPDRSFARGLGRDVFAIPCVGGISDAFICPRCGNCGKFNQVIKKCVLCRKGMVASDTEI